MLEVFQATRHSHHSHLVPVYHIVGVDVGDGSENLGSCFKNSVRYVIVSNGTQSLLLMYYFITIGYLLQISCRINKKCPTH